jgi:hypothetical protein
MIAKGFDAPFNKGMDCGVSQRSAWLRKLNEEYPYQVVLPRRQLLNDSAILDFLLANVGWFDMYVEDDHAAHCAAASKSRSVPRFSAPIRFETSDSRLRDGRVGHQILPKYLIRSLQGAVHHLFAHKP